MIDGEGRMAGGMAMSTIERVAAIYQRHLSAARVPIDRTMFDLGVDSMMAAGIVLDLEEAFAIEVPFEMLVDEPTIEQLADWLDGQVVAGRA